MNYTVGQELWYVPSQGHSRNSEAVFIKSIGRKWAHLEKRYQFAERSGSYDFGKMSLETGLLYGGEYMSPGRCYISKSEYDESVRLNAEWKAFQTAVAKQSRRPEGLSPEDLRYALTLLHLASPEEASQ